MPPARGWIRSRRSMWRGSERLFVYAWVPPVEAVVGLCTYEGHQEAYRAGRSFASAGTLPARCPPRYRFRRLVHENPHDETTTLVHPRDPARRVVDARADAHH